MKATVKTYGVTYTSGRKEIVYATSLKELKTMITWGMVKECALID